MSTKIYEAYRIPVNKLDNFTIKFYNHTFENALQRIKLLENSLTPAAYYTQLVEDFGKDIADNMLNGTHGARIYSKLDAALSRCGVAARKPNRDILFDIECGLTCWLSEKFSYIIPYGEHWTRENFSLPSYAEDYSYWNNTDQPENISRREWLRRGKTWNSVINKPSAEFKAIDLKGFGEQYKFASRVKAALGIREDLV